MLLVENVLHEFLNDFLNKRNLPFPDGRMLYAYQMNQREYLELKEKLNELCQNEELVDLLRNKDFSRCFVLYASEWWKREYSGGVWSWEPIFKTISNDEIKTHQVQVRSRAITEALEYWKYRNSLATGKKFLGAIIANGGLPSKFMQSDKYSSIVRVLRGILRFAGENNANDNELFMRTKEAVKKLPEAIRKDEICELIANLVSTIIKLKRDYALDGETQPVQILNQRCPSWKEQFPLLMEDASVEKMLVGFVEEASRIKRNNVRGKIPSVDRIFDFSESDQLKFLFNFPEFDVSAAYFSKFFEISNAEELPQTFYINNLDLKNTTVAIVTMQLGSRKKYKIKKFDDRLDNVLNSVTISLSSADNKIHSKLVAISEKLDINAPFVFTKNDDDTLILKSNGSTYLRENECYIAYKPGIFDLSEFGTLERTVHIGNSELPLIKCTSDIETEQFFVKLNASNPSNNKYCLDGNIISYKAYPHVAYKGVPEVVCYDEDGKRVTIASKYITYYHKGINLPITDIQNFSGIVDIHCNHGDIERVYTVTIFPADLEIKFDVSDGEYITFSDMNCIKILPVVDKNVQFTEIAKNEFKFHYLGQKPDKICFKIYWYSGGASFIYIPYPCMGVSFFDENGKCIDLFNISILHLMGKKIKIYNNLTKSEKYKLVFKLERANKKGKQVENSRPIFTYDSLTEIKLIDFEDNIKNLLGYTDDENDLIKVSVQLNNKEMGFIGISRYDTYFVLENSTISIPSDQFSIYSNEMLKNTNVVAINLLDPEVPVIPLAQNTDSGIFTGYWSIENLDSSANTYMITSDQKSDISIKPFILCKDKAFESLSDFHKKIIISDIVSANSGSTITCSSDDLETYLISGLHSYKSELWKDIGDLKQVFATQNISLTALKLWQVLCSNEFLLARLLLFCSSERIIMQKIRDELISVPAIISFATWEAAITEYLQYLREAFAKIPGMESMLKSMISEQFKVLTDTFPEIEVTVYYLLFKISCNFTDMIEFNGIIPHVGKAINFTEQQLSDEIFTKNKYDENDEIEELCWMQILQAQNSLEEDNWIPLPFPQLYQEIQSMYPQELSNLASYLFKLNKFSYFIEYVVNFPQLCAFYAFYNAKSRDEIRNLMKFSIKDFMNFNQNYFIEVYKIAISIMLRNSTK